MIPRCPAARSFCPCCTARQAAIKEKEDRILGLTVERNYALHFGRPDDNKRALEDMDRVLYALERMNESEAEVKRLKDGVRELAEKFQLHELWDLIGEGATDG